MKIKRNEQGLAEIKLKASKLLGNVLEEIAADARRIVPKDTEELMNSIEVKHEPGSLEGSVVVGTDHWAETEYGSDPHIIESKGNYSLSDGNGEYFGPRVNHPGTPEQPFLRPSLYKKRDLKSADED